MIPTSNQYSMLAIISEPRRGNKVLATTEDQKTPNIINKHHNNANNPVSSKTPEDKSSSDPHNLTASIHNLQDEEMETRVK
jgi:hypothetical protein